MSVAVDPTWVGACQRCIAGTHGMVRNGHCICCGEVTADV